jgi:hypothetical protein
MSSTVFILGAGASKQAGAPLMADFLDTAYDLWRLKLSGDVAKAFELVFKGISDLQSVHSKANLNIDNIESVFAAFEMAKTLHGFGGYTSDRIDELLRAMRHLIVETIQRTLKLPVQNDRFPSPPEPYGNFAAIIKYLMEEARPTESVAIMTFNYDLAIDFACLKAGLGVNYALEEGKARSDIPVLKLHGSLNWAYCSKCEKVVPWGLRQYFDKYKWEFLEPGRCATLRMGDHIKDFEHCSQKVEPEPVLVPPTWNKTEYHREISGVWARAARELSDAENIFVIGYSMPPTDEFFRHLYGLGTVGDKLLRRFWVFNPDSSGYVENRFRELLGFGAKARFKYYPKTFAEAIGIIKDEFPAKR